MTDLDPLQRLSTEGDALPEQRHGDNRRKQTKTGRGRQVPWSAEQALPRTRLPKGALTNDHQESQRPQPGRLRGMVVTKASTWRGEPASGKVPRPEVSPQNGGVVSNA